MSALSLRELAVALGGDIVGRQVNCPGPNHSRRDRSLGVKPSASSPVGFVVHSYSNDDFATCRDYVLGRLGMPLDAWRTKGSSVQRPAPTFIPREPSVEIDNTARIARAVAIWNEARPAQGSLVETYLSSRGLDLPAGADVLRYHPATPWRDEAENRTIFVPAMVAAMRQIDTDVITAVHRTRLTPEGIKVNRRMLGQASGAAIKLDADDAVAEGLAVGEGIETVLAAQRLGFSPSWALASAGAIAAFPVLAGIEALTILSENDETNAKAVNACASRWHAAGREVIVIQPQTGSDLNDVLKGAA